MSVPNPEDRQVFTFLLVPGFSMMSLASALEPLRSLNRLARREAFEWRLAALDGMSVEASNGIPFPVAPYAEVERGTAYLFVCGGLRIQEANERRYLAILREAARKGISVGSLSTGTYLLARAGLLAGYRCTIHWENRSAFQEDFPDLDCTDKIYEIDRDRLTCSGGTGAMDMMLHLIAERHGPDLARGVANQFHHERIRDDREVQRVGRLDNPMRLPEKVRGAIAAMQRQIEEPVSLPSIAKRVGVSSRQLERLFLRHAGMTPLRCYMQIRIERARELLLYSERPIIDVAVAAGFTSATQFALWYKRFYGVPPSEMRGRPGPAAPPLEASRNRV